MEMLGGYRARVGVLPRCRRARTDGDPARVHGARWPTTPADFVLVLEDLQHWDNADHLAGLSMDRARMCIAAAGRSARVVDRSARMPLHCRRSRASTRRLPAICSCPRSSPVGSSTGNRPAVPVPAAVAAVRRAVRRARRRGASQALTERRCCCTATSGPTTCSSTVIGSRSSTSSSPRVGAGAADVGYLVSQGLPTEVRRGHDEALVREYLDMLVEHGVDRLLVRRGVAALPLRRRLSDGAAGRSR